MKKIEITDSDIFTPNEYDPGIYLVYFPISLKSEIWSVNGSYSWCIYTTFHTTNPDEYFNSMLSNLEAMANILEKEVIKEVPQKGTVSEEFTLRLAETLTRKRK